MDPISAFVVNHLIGLATTVVMPLMLGTFVIMTFTRMLIYYYARAQRRISLEFEKRARIVLNDISAGTRPRVHSFQVLANQLMQATHYECFELRARYKRRNLDHVTSLADRLFLIQDGSDRLIADTRRNIRYLNKDGAGAERLMDITKHAFNTNPYFNRIIGVFPMGLMNELTNIMPGLFIIAGIFGTFLGISKGLPELGNMDLMKPEEAKHIMDIFLVSISQAMVKSIIGIFLSVTMTLINTFFSPDGNYYDAVNRYAATLDSLWNETDTNEVEKEPIKAA